MRFIINSQVFAKQVQALSGVIPNNNTLPSINGFYFNLKGNVLTIKTTDLETTMMASINLETADDSGAAAVVVPAKLLMDTLKSFDDVPLTFNVDPSNFSIELAWGTGNCRLAGINPESYPELPAINDTVKTTIMASTLVNAINKTSFAASNDDLRPQMAGIYVELKPENATFVATDAHKLVRYRCLDVHSEEPSSFILPRKPILHVKNILAGLSEDCEVVLEYNNTNVSFTFGNYYIVCRLVDGKYPNYEAAIPKENPNRLTVDRNSFLNVLRRVKIFASMATQQVRLDISEHEIQITSEDIEFSSDAKEKIPCQYEGTPMEIGFNAKFLVEMVSNIDTENILIELSQPNRAGILFPMYSEETSAKVDMLMLVMPVMLAN
ncbi:MAG: DNA polymerase III subunit beta [Bacteroidales bacterium]|nr:DNA polymerase III subunit beta [Bacteroidales bacterium]